jgi:hypothetical protein
VHIEYDCHAKFMDTCIILVHRVCALNNIGVQFLHMESWRDAEESCDVCGIWVCDTKFLHTRY